jgi:hypothetical protein
MLEYLHEYHGPLVRDAPWREVFSEGGARIALNVRPAS